MKEFVLYAAPALSVMACILLLVRPLWGVIAIFFVRPLVDGTWDQTMIGDFKLTEIVSSVVPLIIFARMVLDDSGSRPVKDMPLKWIWFLASLDALRFSTTIMLDHDWREGLQVLFRHLNGITGWYMVQAYCRSERDFLRFAWGLAVAGFFPMATGLYEGLTGFHWRVTIGPNEVVRDVGLYHDGITIRWYAQQAMIGLLFIYTLSRRSFALTAFCVGYALISTYVLRGAFSKSGYLTVGLWLLLWPLLRRNFKAMIGLGIAAILGALYFSKELMDQVGFVFKGEIAAAQGTGALDQTLEGRWGIWEDMAREWQSLGMVSRLLGSGHGANGAHNDYLQVLFSGGLLALGIYVLLLLAVGWCIVRLLTRRTDIWAIGALFVFLLWMVDSVGLTPSAYSAYQWFVWGVIGFCLRYRQDEQRVVPRPTAVAAPSRRYANLLGAT
jgi:O-antigen ligase